MSDHTNEPARKIRGTVKVSQFPKVDLTPHLAALTAVGRQSAARDMEAGLLKAQLAVSVRAGRYEEALAEVARRQDLFASTWSESSRTGDRPDVAALKSVVDDVVAGRWLL